jgi:hypothetical protein
MTAFSASPCKGNVFDEAGEAFSEEMKSKGVCAAPGNCEVSVSETPL